MKAGQLRFWAVEYGTAIAISIIAALGIAGGFLPCYPRGTRSLPTRDPSIAHQDDDIREAMFRYLFRDGAGSGAKVYFLEINGHDPSLAFLHRFQGNKPPVKAHSQGRPSSDYFGHWRDRATNQVGIELSVDGIQWVSAKKVKVQAGYYFARLGSLQATFPVVWQGNRWLVKEPIEPVVVSMR